MNVPVIATLAKYGLFLGFLLGALAPIMVWIERRVCGLIQDRPGPNRLGPFGLLQPLADALKFIFKEDVTPSAVDRPLYLLAPILSMVPALSAFVVIPFGPPAVIDGHTVRMVVADVDAGVLVMLALSSLGVYSLVLAGYASNNKFSLLGSIRASAQLISYELAMAVAVLAVLLPVQSFRLDTVVDYQHEHLWNVIPQALGFLIFLIAAFAETNRLPFDLPEAESELVAGYHTEYSAMRFAAFMAAEYINMGTLSALAATLYFGGWRLPFVDPPETWYLAALMGFGVLAAKIGAFMILFVWVRWTFPRFRYDQLMRLGWKVLLPLSLVNLLWVAVATLKGWM